MKRFCVETILVKDADLLQDFRSIKGKLFLQMLFTHMYCNNYIIAEEYFNYYVDLMTTRNFRGYFIVDDEFQQMSNYDDDHDSYLHPSDLFAVNVPEMWLKLFHAADIHDMIQINFLIPSKDGLLVHTYSVWKKKDLAMIIDVEASLYGSIDVGASYKPP